MTTDNNQSSANNNTAPTDPNVSAGSATSSTGSNARVIKRYSNRKLYDTVESRYVTLPQIAELVRKGEEVRIIDNNSKEDLTRVTLAQILYEEERKQPRALPLTALKDLIHTSGERIMSSLREGPMGKLIGRSSESSGNTAPAEQSNSAQTSASATATASPAATTTTASATVTSSASAASVPTSAEANSGSAGKEKTEKEGASAPGRLAEMLEQSRGSIQEWQHRVDERVRKVLESLSPSSQIEKLQAEVKKLTQRVEALEAKQSNTKRE